MKKKKVFKPDEFLLDIFVYAILILVAVATLYPAWYVLVASFGTSTDLAASPGLLLWPRNFNLGAYKMVFQHALIMNGIRNTLLILVLALPLNIIMTMLCGYFLASTNVPGKKWIAGMIMFTMFFSGGMIPSYLNVKDLGLYNSIWSLVIPGVLSVYNAIICKTAIEAVPASLSESASLDGANDFQIIFKVITPLIKPTLAVLLLYYGVAHWNSWFNASIYIKEDAKLPLQNVIRAIMLQNSTLSHTSAGVDDYNKYADTIKYAAIVVTTVPILCVYPFLQKHFTKGVMIGAVKG